MPRVMIVVGSARPDRVGLPIAQWVRDTANERGGFELDFADLGEIKLPFMDEPNPPRLRQYTKQHTLDWSARVDEAEGFIFVTPEYNHSFSPALKNALDFLAAEWWRKPVGFVSYGGAAAGSRSVTGLEPTLATLGLVRVGAEVNVPLFPGPRVVDGAFVPTDKEAAVLGSLFSELELLSGALKPAQL